MAPPATIPLAGVVGPTASGKSELAIPLAERLGAEVIVADSRQVYRGIDVATAKPTSAERSRIPHHLLDLVDPDQPFTVADWVRAAREAIGQIGARGRLSLVVGGTGLYVSALLDGHDYTGAPSSVDQRAALAAELEAEGLDVLAGRLSRLAPDLAAVTDLRNPRRVLRALERAESGERGPRSASSYPGVVALVALRRPREVLYARIDDRARRLFERGLLDEVRGLLAAGHGSERGPLTGHGYREAARHLAGEWSLEEAIAVTARRTRQYAKRQLTWFRRDPRITWLDAGEAPGDDPRLVEEAAALLRARLDGA